MFIILLHKRVLKKERYYRSRRDMVKRVLKKEILSNKERYYQQGEILSKNFKENLNQEISKQI